MFIINFPDWHCNVIFWVTSPGFLTHPNGKVAHLWPNRELRCGSPSKSVTFSGIGDELTNPSNRPIPKIAQDLVNGYSGYKPSRETDSSYDDATTPSASHRIAQTVARPGLSSSALYPGRGAISRVSHWGMSSLDGLWFISPWCINSGYGYTNFNIIVGTKFSLNVGDPPIHQPETRDLGLLLDGHSPKIGPIDMDPSPFKRKPKGSPRKGGERPQRSKKYQKITFNQHSTNQALDTQYDWWVTWEPTNDHQLLRLHEGAEGGDGRLGVPIERLHLKRRLCQSAHTDLPLVQWMIPQAYEGHGGADSPARINQTDVASSSRSHPFQRSHNLAPRPSLLQCNQASFAWETQPLRLCNSTIRIELIDQFDARTNSLILMLCIDCKDISKPDLIYPLPIPEIGINPLRQRFSLRLQHNSPRQGCRVSDGIFSVPKWS